jgi:phosphoglycolate phosphatase
MDERYSLRHLRMMSIEEMLRFIPGAWWRGPYLMLTTKRKLSKMMDKILPISGMTYTLRTLHDQDYDLVILTSNNKANVVTFLRKHGMEDFFANIIETRGLFNKAKHIEKTLKKNNLHASDIIYVGDEIRDIVACQKIGVRIIAVTFGFNSKEGLARWNPDYIVSKPLQILDIIDKLTPQKSNI